MISATDRFVTQAELDERKRVRQEEWEKVRKPEEPVEAPEEEYDPRSLYDRLKENRDKKQAEIDESRKFKNMIRGLDTDEVGFLSLVDDVKAAADRKKRDEEKQLLEEVHRARTTQQEEILNAVEQRRTTGGQSTSTASSVVTNRTSKQAMLLSRAIIKRKKSLSDDDEESEPTTSAKKSHNVVADAPDDVGVCSTVGNRSLIPGIGDYESSSDDDKSHKSE